MSIRVLVNGALGRMGKVVTAHIGNYPNLKLAGQTGSQDDLGLAIQNANAQVVIDFTLPDAVYKNTLTILHAGARPVVGTTGLKLDQITALQEIASKKQLGGMIAPNFSIAGILMMQCAQKIAAHIADVEIIEFHHEAKLDSPSGTSLRTAELIAANRNAVTRANHADYRETYQGARGAAYQSIPIHSIRLPGLLAHQSVVFGQMGETLTIKHDTIDRACFMPGVFLACEKVMNLNYLAYGLENILS